MMYFVSLIIGYRHSDSRLSNLKEVIKRFDKNCIEIIIIEKPLIGYICCQRQIVMFYIFSEIIDVLGSPDRITERLRS